MKKESPDEMISYCPFCGRKHGGNYALCTECGALMCDSCDSVERRKMNDGEPLCPDCKAEKLAKELKGEPKCPSCGKKLDHLTNVVVGTTEFFHFYLDEGTGHYETGKSIAGNESYYECPECGETVAQTEEEAIDLLK